MKVLILPSWYPNDITDLSGSFFREQAIALSETNCDIIVADAGFVSTKSFFTDKQRRYKSLSITTDNGIKVCRKKSASFGRFSNVFFCMSTYRKNIKYILKRLKEEGVSFDVIHAHSYLPAGIIACEIGEEYNIPVVITEHSSSFLKFDLTKKRVNVLKDVLRRCNKFISVSKALEDSVRQYCGSCEKMIVIPNIVNSIFSPNYNSFEANRKFTFISIGSLIDRKRHLFTIRAFAEAFKNDSNVLLKIIGEGEDRIKIEKYITKNSLTDKVLLMGSLSRESVVSEYRNSDVFVLASTAETFGVVYIEALSCGLPVIATKNGGANDIINKENGILVRVDDFEEMVQSFKNMKIMACTYSKEELYNNTQQQYGAKQVSETIVNLYKVLKRDQK